MSVLSELDKFHAAYIPMSRARWCDDSYHELRPVCILISNSLISFLSLSAENKSGIIALELSDRRDQSCARYFYHVRDFTHKNLWRWSHVFNCAMSSCTNHLRLDITYEMISSSICGIILCLVACVCFCVHQTPCFARLIWWTKCSFIIADPTDTCDKKTGVHENDSKTIHSRIRWIMVHEWRTQIKSRVHQLSSILPSRMKHSTCCCTEKLNMKLHTVSGIMLRRDVN